MVKSVDWSPNSKRLATGGNEGILRVFDIMNPDRAPLEFIQNEDEVCVSYNILFVVGVMSID